MNRQEIVSRLQAQVALGIPIIGAGAGTGLSAASEERGGADLIIIYNSGRLRMAGRGSSGGLLPYGDANAIVVEMAAEVLPLVRNTPVLAGVCGTDPWRLMDKFLPQLRDLGFSGVQNFPTVGVIDGSFRRLIEETGYSYGLEVDMIRAAHELDLLTCPYVFNPDEAAAMAQAGADVIVPHLSTTVGGSIGAQTSVSLEQAAQAAQLMAEAAKRVNPKVLVLCHGGPIATPDDAAYVISHTEDIVGFFGASSMERLPVETAIVETVQKFKAIRLDGAAK
jgi:predicted TIM-barrel enzyme